MWLKCEKVHATRDAVKIKLASGSERWVPRSAIYNETTKDSGYFLDLTDYFYDKLTTEEVEGTLIIPEWAEKDIIN